MLKTAALENLDIAQLFALALYTEEYNIHFFSSWANRLRPYNAEAVSLLTDMAENAQKVRDSLYDSSRRMFPYGLPELEPELYAAARHDLDLPDFRFFVVNGGEARQILNAALKLQQDTIKLLARVDRAVRKSYEVSIDLNLAAAQYEAPKLKSRRAIYDAPRISAVE